MISHLQKDNSIKTILAKLYQRFGESNFTLTDYWDADLCAIGIKNSIDSEFLIYISTWQTQKDLYFVDVEDSNGKAVLGKYKEGHLNQINFEELSKLVTKYLHLQPTYEK